MEKKEDRGQLDLTFQIEKLTKRAQEAEGELSIIKGMNRNEAKELNNRIAELLQVNEKHQQLNGKLQVLITELEEDNKKLAQQIEDYADSVNKYRNKGVI